MIEFPQIFSSAIFRIIVHSKVLNPQIFSSAIFKIIVHSKDPNPAPPDFLPTGAPTFPFVW